MEAIYNIYFECEKPSGRIQVPGPNNSLFVALYGNSRHCSSALIPPSPAEPGGCSLAHEDVLSWRWPRSPEHAACFSLRPRGCWLPFPPCTWARFRFLFHEILERENLPSLLWQAGDHYHFRAEGGKITWREHWVQALPLRNKVSEAQRSERTWLLRLGDLRQSGDFSPNGGPTFSIKIQTLNEWVLYGHLCKYLLTDDYLRMDVSMLLCWITCYPIFIVPSRNKALSFLSTVLSPSPFYSAKQDPLGPPVPYAEHGWGLQVFSRVLGLGMSPGPVWDLEIVKLQRDYHGAGPCSPSLDPGSIWPQAPWTMLPSQEGIHQCCYHL